MTYFKSGDWNAECERCGFVYKASQLVKEWTGFMVCKKCWEPRHESDFFRLKPEKTSVPYVAQESDDLSPVSVVTGNQSVNVAGSRVYEWSADLTSNITITLDTTGAAAYDRVQLWRTGAGAYTANIGGLVTTASGAPFFAEVEYNGTSWTLVHLTYLGL